MMQNSIRKYGILPIKYIKPEPSVMNACRGKLIFSARNPVVEKVQVVEGIGLMNVKVVVDKYGSDFAISCDVDKFQVVVT